MILPRPRAYIDWIVPLDDQGNEIGVCHDAETYQRYIDWLADYLFFTAIPIPENQVSLVAEFEAKDGIRSAVFWLSDDWGMSIWYTEGIENAFFEGVSYEDFHQQEMSVWNNLPADERELYENPADEFYASKDEYNRIGHEAIEAKKIPAHIQHADIAYRAILAALLKKVEDKKERIAHLDYFYRNFNECASK